jgi:hypothetical protein
MRRLTLLVVLLAACGNDDGGGSDFTEGQLVQIADVTDEEVDVLVRVQGPVIRVDDTTRICAAILESFPPQCGEPSLIVDGWDIDADPRAQSAGDVTWVENVELTGTISDGTLTAAAG